MVAKRPIEILDPESETRPKRARQIKGSKHNPITVSDSDPDIGESSSLEKRNGPSDGDEIQIVDAHGNTKTPPSLLFYTESGESTAMAHRCLAIMPMDRLKSSMKSEVDLQVSDGWSAQRFGEWRLRFFIEGLSLISEDEARRRDFYFYHDGSSPNRSAVRMTDIRFNLAELLRVDDPLSLQIEVQTLPISGKHVIFYGGKCTRPDATWTDITVTDNQSLNEALPPKAWLRVRKAEYIRVDIEPMNMSIAVTPCSSATVNQLRNLITTTTQAAKGAVCILHNGKELHDSAGLLKSLDLRNESILRVELKEPRECVNCLESFFLSDISQPMTEACLHEIDVCDDCVQTWIGTCLDNGNWNGIHCLTADCQAILQYADMRRAADAAQMQRYEHFTLQNAVDAIPGFMWCQAPDCGSGQIHENRDGNEPIFRCNSCDAKQCAACHREWHPDETCEQVAQRLATQPDQNAASEAFIAANNKRCPGCNSPIEKRDGCDHISCTRCRMQFCWLCQADYRDIHREGNTAHKPDCRYHSGNIPDPHGPQRRRRPMRGGLGAELDDHAAQPGRPQAPPPPPNAMGQDFAQNIQRARNQFAGLDAQLNNQAHFARAQEQERNNLREVLGRQFDGLLQIEQQVQQALEPIAQQRRAWDQLARAQQYHDQVMVEHRQMMQNVDRHFQVMMQAPAHLERIHRRARHASPPARVRENQARGTQQQNQDQNGQAPDRA